jgi:GT2 family glycosyltransferase
VDTIEVVSATRVSEADFWSRTPLGVTLQRLMAFDKRIVPMTAVSNSRGLPEVFNDRISASECDVIVFIHDDALIEDYFFADRVLEGLKHYDVIGVAGNRRRLDGQELWHTPPGMGTFDNGFLSGAVAHGNHALGSVMFYGPVPAACEFLDGVLLAARVSRLKECGVKFDSQFTFHFYDLDFCRSARTNGLTLGTWPISLTHAGKGGGFVSDSWRENRDRYFAKWGK